MQFRTTLGFVVLVGLAVGCAEDNSATSPTAPVSAPLLALVAGSNVVGPIYAKSASTLCMDVKGISKTAGTPLQLYACKTGQSNQQFLWKTDGTLQAYSGTSGLCVADEGGLNVAGDRIVIAACNGSASQKWSASSSGQIVGSGGKCIGASSVVGSAGLVLQACGTAAGQQWDSSQSTAPAPTPTPAPTTGNFNYNQVVAGIRPRGFGQGTYTLSAPVNGGRALYVATTGNDANAGTSSGSPFRTIAKAAQVARAGDVVTIANGTYSGSVVVANSGTSTSPIVFQAASRGGVVLTDGNASFRPSTWYGGVQETGQLYVTIRGLTFRAYASNAAASPGPSFPAAVKAARGWRIEDCLFDNAGNTAVQIMGSYVSVVKSTLQYTYFEALAAWAKSNATSTSDPAYTPLDGIRITDVVLRGNYAKNTAPTSGGVADYSSKFLTTRGTVIDNMETYQNNGPGFWFDTQNSAITVTNSYFHDNRNIAGTSNTGRGLNLEANWGPALIEHNVFQANASMGMAVTAGQGMTIRQNMFINNPRCMELTNDLARVTNFPLKNIGIYNNQCANWTNFSGIQTVGGATAFTTPSAMNIKADSNVYQPGSASIMAWWENKTIGAAYTLSDFRTKWGWEANGRIGTAVWQ